MAARGAERALRLTAWLLPRAPPPAENLHLHFKTTRLPPSIAALFAGLRRAASRATKPPRPPGHIYISTKAQQLQALPRTLFALLLHTCRRDHLRPLLPVQARQFATADTSAPPWPLCTFGLHLPHTSSPVSRLLAPAGGGRRASVCTPLPAAAAASSAVERKSTAGLPQTASRGAALATTALACPHVRLTYCAAHYDTSTDSAHMLPPACAHAPDARVAPQLVAMRASLLPRARPRAHVAGPRCRLAPSRHLCAGHLQAGPLPATWAGHPARPAH